jgi:ComEC/Rec2-related protein
MLTALGCIASVVCGAMLSHLEGRMPIVLAMTAVLLIAAWAWARSARQDTEAQHRLTLATLIVLGLARGASLGSPPSPAPGRGAEPSPELLREFEVVGASEPGVRCAVELRDPGGSRSSTLRVSAPPEVCPLSAGQRVAVLAPALRERWQDSLGDAARERRDLGHGPVLWLRPSPEPSPLERLEFGYWRRVAALRQRAWSSTRGDPSASLVVAVGLGLRAALTPEQREQLRAAGLGHLIAVSGLHVAVAALWLQALARRAATLLGLSPRVACVLTHLPLWAYVGLTGAAPSAVRAALMLTGIDLAAVVGRPRHPPTLLACAAAGMLLWQPAWLFEPGFALSIAAMTAIVTAPRELGVLAMSWRITWATAPLSVLWFNAAPLHGLVANAFALPLFALLMPLSLVAVLAPGSLGALGMALATRVAAPILDLAALLAKLPSAGAAGLALLAALALLGHAALRRRARRAPPVELEFDRPRAPLWLPPMFACVLALVLAVGSLLAARLAGRSTAPIEFDWIALGSVHSRSLLVADPSQDRAACLYRPRESTATMRALLDQLGVRRLSRVDAELPKPDDPPMDPAMDPATRALIEQLERGGIELHDADGCRPPPAAEVREALRICRARQAGRGSALARSYAGVLSCRVGDRWVEVDEV